MRSEVFGQHSIAADVDSLRAGSERARRRVKWEGDGFLPWACRFLPRLCLRAIGFGKRGATNRKRSVVAVFVVGATVGFGLVADNYRRNTLLRQTLEAGEDTSKIDLD